MGITIANKQSQQMEFLIPPKENDSAIEIREQIRAALYSPDSKQETVSSHDPKSEMSPVYNDKTKLFSPHAATFKEKEADRLSRWLVIVIFSILTAVFIACYKEEIGTFLEAQLTPMAQFVSQCWEWTVLRVAEMWNEITEMSNTLKETMITMMEKQTEVNQEEEGAVIR